MMKKMRTILTGLLLVAILGTAGCGGSSKTAEQPAAQPAAEAKQEFRVGMECGYPPFNWTQIEDNGIQIDGNAEFAGGYDVQIAKKIADGLGRDLVVVKTEWDGLVPALQSGVIDAIIAGMSPTAERKGSIDFTDAYYRSNLVMIVKKGGEYENATKLSDFSGAKIVAQLNTFHDTVIDQIPDVQHETAMPDFPTMRVALESDIIDGYVGERPEGVSATAANPNFACVEFAEGEGFECTDDDVAVAVGIAKGNEDLVAQINDILAGISEEERLEIMDQAVKDQPAEQ